MANGGEVLGPGTILRPPEVASGGSIAMILSAGTIVSREAGPHGRATVGFDQLSWWRTGCHSDGETPTQEKIDKHINPNTMLRRITLVLSAASLFVAKSCVRDSVVLAACGEREVSIQAQLPADFATRAIGDGTQATTLTYAVYDKAKTDAPVLYVEDAEDVMFVGNKASLTLRLATGHSYDIVFWADAAVAEGASNPYTFDQSNKSITVNYSGATANDESRDAFFGQIADLEVNGAVNQTVTLTRPFAQLNLGTDDAAAAEALGVTIDKSSVKVANVCTSLNLLDGTAQGASEVTFAMNAVPTEQLTVGAKEYGYLGMNYILVAASEAGDALTDCTITLNDGAKDLPAIALNSVPLKRNHRTNILGSLITSPANIEITVDGELAGDVLYNKLLLAAAIGGEVSLTKDLTIDETIVVRNGVRMVVNLNGNDLICNNGGADEGTSGAGAIWVREGELVINNTKTAGMIDGGSGSEHCTVAAFGPNSKITINGGKFTVGGGNTATGYGNYNNCVYAYDGAQIVINGGTFQNEAPQTGSTDLYAVLNVHNTKPGTITVNGGTFVNYDPATGDDNRGGSFVANDCVSVKTSDTPTYQVVCYEPSTDLALDQVCGIDQQNKNIVVSADMPATDECFKFCGSGTINMNGKNIVSSHSDQVIMASGSCDLTITGSGSLTLSPTKPATNASAIWVGKGCKVTIDGDVTVNCMKGKSSVSAILVKEGGEVVINNGHFISGTDVNGNGGACVLLNGTRAKQTKLTINGGVFESEPFNGLYYTINIQDSARDYCQVSITGGTFINFDPANITNEGKWTSFVAEGHKSVETTYNGKQAWKVVPE